MKRREYLLYVLIAILTFLVIGLSINSINIQKGMLISRQQILKEMDESVQVTNLNSQITTLNASHQSYVTAVENYKKTITEAITNQGISTSLSASEDVVKANIEKILEVRTSDADATADNITAGKKAYVDGKLIVGNGTDNENSGSKLINLGTGDTFDLTSYANYASFTEENFIVEITNFSGTANASYGTPEDLGSKNCYGQGKITGSVSKTYDPTSGTLTLSNDLVLTGKFIYGTSVSNISKYATKTVTPTITYTVYLYY